MWGGCVARSRVLHGPRRKSEPRHKTGTPKNASDEAPATQLAVGPAEATTHEILVGVPLPLSASPSAEAPAAEIGLQSRLRMNRCARGEERDQRGGVAAVTRVVATTRGAGGDGGRYTSCRPAQRTLNSSVWCTSQRRTR